MIFFNCVGTLVLLCAGRAHIQAQWI